MKPPWTAAARSALERFLQLAGDFVGRGLHGALHDFGGLGERLVKSFFDGRLANRDEPCVSPEVIISKRSPRRMPSPFSIADWAGGSRACE
jgi:hypothetical protein